jgi:hypothetical protein
MRERERERERETDRKRERGGRPAEKKNSSVGTKKHSDQPWR